MFSLSSLSSICFPSATSPPCIPFTFPFPPFPSLLANSLSTISPSLSSPALPRATISFCIDERENEGSLPSYYYLAADIHSYGLPLMDRRLLPRAVTAPNVQHERGAHSQIIWPSWLEERSKGKLDGAAECPARHPKPSSSQRSRT